MYVFTPNGRSLHFRTSKSTSEDNIIQEIPYGSKVYVIEWDGTWARIQYNGSTGYVVKRFLQIGRPDSFEEVVAAAAQKKAEQQALAEQRAAEQQAQEELKAAQKKLDHSSLREIPEYDVTVHLGYVDATSNLYKKTSLLSDIIVVYPEGTRLSVRAQNADWAKVYDPSTEQEGYMLLIDLIPDIIEDEEILDD